MIGRKNLRKNIVGVLLLYLNCFSFVLAKEAVPLPKGAIESSFAACKNTLITTKAQYDKYREQWHNLELKCHTSVQFAVDSGLSSIDPIKEGSLYLDFSQRVAKKVAENLDKSRRYAECSALCFKGAKTCEKKLNDGANPVVCSDRKKEILYSLKVNTRRIKMELALSTDAPGLLNVNVRNVLSVDKEKLINTNLRDFEIGMPNPVGRIELSDYELQEARRRSDRDRKKLEEEFKAKGAKNYSDWMSAKLMQNFEDHQARYRQLIYEEAPIFAVIDRPAKITKGNDPEWSENQIAGAFDKLAMNATKTKEKVDWSIKNSVIEFSRLNGESLKEWMASLVPGTKAHHDLLYYIGMRNQVEDVLKEDPSLCGVAASLEERLKSKEIQNAGITLAASVLSAGAVKGASVLTSNVFRIGRALSGAEAAGLTGLSLGSVTLGDSFHQYNVATTEATTRSGLDKKKEGAAIVTSADLANKKANLELSLALAPIDVAGGWGLGKSLYTKLSKQMSLERPELAQMIKKASMDNGTRDKIVDLWLVGKIDEALNAQKLTVAEKVALDNKKSKALMQTLVADIEKAKPDFFKKPGNMDFFLKTAATMAKKEKGDLPDLGEKAKFLLLKLKTDGPEGAWDANAQKGLLTVFNNAIDELRLVSKNDPETYLKFTSDKAAQERILRRALQRSGAEEGEMKTMVQCMVP